MTLARRRLKLSLLFLMAALAGPSRASAAEPVAGCRAVGGAEALLSQSAQRYIIVGERHGTAEVPALFGDLACLASARGPLIVGLEMEADQQAALDAFLSSDGSLLAQQAWRRSKHWRLRDGRGSEAMWAMIERLRTLKAQGRDVSALAFMHQANSIEARESAMAEAWRAALKNRPEARLLILIGSVHAESEPVGQSIPAASFIPAQLRLTLGYVPWEAIQCRSLGCRSVTNSSGAQILRQAPAEWRWPRYDAYYTVGRTFTRSPPLSAPAQ
jgi:hypothetical protein